MTGLLEKALQRIEALSREEQDAMASQILDSLDDEEAWSRQLRESPEVLRSLAQEALEEHRRGETRRLSCPEPTAWFSFSQVIHFLEREAGFEPATFNLVDSFSTVGSRGPSARRETFFAAHSPLHPRWVQSHIVHTS
jgi:hypothetical protein